MSVIDKINEFIKGRGWDSILNGKSDVEKYSAITGLTNVNESTLEEKNAEWFIPGGMFIGSDGSSDSGEQTKPDNTATDEDNEAANNAISDAITNGDKNVTIDSVVSDLDIPQTSNIMNISAPLDNNTTVILESNKAIYLNNTGNNDSDVTVSAPAASSATTIYIGGQYDTVTLENTSLNTNATNNPVPPTVKNIVISDDNTTNTSINTIFDTSVTNNITSNCDTSITLTSKNTEDNLPDLNINTPNSTVTLSGKFDEVNASVSENTLIVKKAAHINKLTVNKGNVIVEVPRQSDINNVIGTYTANNIDYTKLDITSSNITKITSTGEMTLTEDITKSGSITHGVASVGDTVINLNNHTLSFTNTKSGSILLRGTAKLEINGEGKIYNETGYGLWLAAASTKLVINSGEYEALTHTIYVESGEAIINGGVFKLVNEDKKFMINCKDSALTSGTAKITINGGKFYGWNPGESYGEPNAPVSFLGNGCQVVETEEDGLIVYEVVK